MPPKNPTPDPETGTLSAQAIATWSLKLADTIETLFDAGEFPVVLSGDCTIVLGSMLALKRRGRYGLIFIDGNTDFFLAPRLTSVGLMSPNVTVTAPNVRLMTISISICGSHRIPSPTFSGQR